MDRLISASIISGFCVAELLLAGIQPSFYTFGVLAVGTCVILMFGNMILRLAGVDNNHSHGMDLELVVGTVATNLVVMGIINLASVSAGRAFFLFAGGIVALMFIFNFPTTALRERRFRTYIPSIDRVSLFHLAILCIVVLAWSRLQASAFPSLQQTGNAQIWIDYFLHGNQIAQYSRVDGLVRGDIELTGEPPVLYHRAIFVLPAAISQLAHVPAFAAATALLLPLGLLVCLLGVAVLGNTLAQDKTTGLLAALLLVVLPDASTYGLRNGFFGFTWLTFTGPGTGWALGICATSLAFSCSWLRTDSRGALILAAALALAVFWHRAHLFILFVPAFVLLAFAAFGHTGIFKPHRVKLVKRAAMLFVGACIAGWIWPEVRTYWLRLSGVEEFLGFAHTLNEPTAYTGWYAYLIEHYGIGVAVPVGIAMIPLAAFGLLLLVFPILYWLKRHRLDAEASDAFPLIMGGVFIAIIMFAPVASWGDPTEYQQRGFPLLYAILLTYCVAYASLLLKQFHSTIGFQPATVRIGLLAILTVGGVILHWGDDPSKPSFSRGEEFHSFQVDSSWFLAGEYLRSHSMESDVFAVVPTAPDAILVDDASALVSLSGVSAFFARAAIKKLSYRGVVEERLAILNKVSSLTSQEAAFELLRRHGINWLVVSNLSALAWDTEGKGADFRDGPLAIYQIKVAN